MYWNECVLCEKSGLKENDATHKVCCIKCPIHIEEDVDCFDANSSFHEWDTAKTSETRKIYAGKLLDIMKSL
jgi:hypothetical protein